MTLFLPRLRSFSHHRKLWCIASSCEPEFHLKFTPFQLLAETFYNSCIGIFGNGFENLLTDRIWLWQLPWFVFNVDVSTERFGNEPKRNRTACVNSMKKTCCFCCTFPYIKIYYTKILTATSPLNQIWELESTFLISGQFSNFINKFPRKFFVIITYCRQLGLSIIIFPSIK